VEMCGGVALTHTRVARATGAFVSGSTEVRILAKG
jgi:hypothetical protein